MNKIETYVQDTYDRCQEEVNEIGKSSLCVITINDMEFYRAVKVQKKVVKKTKRG